MNGTRLQLALREMRRHLGDPRVFGSLLLVGLLFGLAGPFGTFADLETVPRILYWEAVVIVTYVLGYGLAVTAGRAVRGRLLHPVLGVVLVGLIIGPPATGVVIVINLLTFGPAGWYAIDALALLVYVTISAIGVTAIVEVIDFSLRGARQRPVSTPTDTSPPILQRVPLPQRGTLIALSVADHYVEVTTDRGKALVLMRLADAMRETGATKGLQIHRSHWVALDAVVRVARRGGKPFVEVRGGGSYPISRGFLPAAKAAGLIV